MLINSTELFNRLFLYFQLCYSLYIVLQRKRRFNSYNLNFLQHNVKLIRKEHRIYGCIYKKTRF